LIYIGLFLLSLVLTYGIKEYALKKAILDVPNERSSHSIPTPRGGGLAIIITFLIGLLVFHKEFSSTLLLALFSVLPIVFVSLIDDVKSLTFKTRLIVQSFSIVCALYFLGGITHIDFGFFELSGAWLNIFAFIVMIWLTNLYNFLDGIDGYAASQTIMVGMGLFSLFGNSLGLLLIVSTLGFLLFNWHKASIFMGDVGSASLGFIVGVLIFSETSANLNYFWLIILSLFWFDATLTLLKRFKNGEKITQAHRKHAYQRLVQSGWSHARVTLGLIFFNLLSLCLLYVLDFIVVFFINLMLLTFVWMWTEKKKGFHDV